MNFVSIFMLFDASAYFTNLMYVLFHFMQCLSKKCMEAQVSIISAFKYRLNRIWWEWWEVELPHTIKKKTKKMSRFSIMRNSKTTKECGQIDQFFFFARLLFHSEKKINFTRNDFSVTVVWITQALIYVMVCTFLTGGISVVNLSLHIYRFKYQTQDHQNVNNTEQVNIGQKSIRKEIVKGRLVILCWRFNW